MSKNSVLISINTYDVTEASSFGKQFIEGLCKQSPRLVPELVSTSEICKERFVDAEHFVNDWWAVPVSVYEDRRYIGNRYAGPFWKRRSNLASRGYVRHGIVDLESKRTLSSIWYQCRWDREIDFSHLFDAWVRLSHPEIGMLHVFTQSELRGTQSEERSWFETGSFGGPFKPGLPNIGWAMAYGKGYSAELDLTRIEAAGFSVDELDGIAVVRVTERLSDVVEDFAYFSSRRTKLKDLFRPGLFWMAEQLPQAVKS